MLEQSLDEYAAGRISLAELRVRVAMTDAHIADMEKALERVPHGDRGAGFTHHEPAWRCGCQPQNVEATRLAVFGLLEEHLKRYADSHGLMTATRTAWHVVAASKDSARMGDLVRALDEEHRAHGLDYGLHRALDRLRATLF